MKKVLSVLVVLFFSFQLNAQWKQTNGPYASTISCLAVSPNGSGGTNLFAGASGGGGTNGVYLSTDKGTTWTAVDYGLPTSPNIYALAVSPNGIEGTNLFAGTFGNGVYLSTNNGTNWTAVDSGMPPNSTVNALLVSGKNLFAGTGGGVWLSTNNGTSWSAAYSGMTQLPVTCFVVSPNGISGTNLFAGTNGEGVFLSQNDGTSWSAVNSGLPHFPYVYSLAVSGTNLFTGTYSRGMYLSTNDGTSWTAIDSELTNLNVLALAVSGTNLFVGTFGGGVFLSTNNGTSWSAVDSGLTEHYIYSFAVTGTNLFAGTDHLGGVWIRALSEMITDVNQTESNLSTNFRLQQNYPNPFNPTTTLNYSVPKTGLVTLKVCDILGREVAALVNEQKTSGKYEVQFNASNLTSGVYFYRLQAGIFVDTKKMILLK